MSSEIPEADRVEGAPHPRLAVRVIGHEAALARFASAMAEGRIPHACLITGPRGIGKATLAWCTARALLTAEPGASPTFRTDPGHPVARRMAALAEPGLFLLRRPWDAKAKRLKATIGVDEVRGLKGFFALSRPDGGWRAVIVDAADDLTQAAANALLKLLEEPPERTVFLLVAHRPNGLLPTIRSRCRLVPLAPLPDDELDAVLSATPLDPALQDTARPALVALAGGSAGLAVQLNGLDGPGLQQDLDKLLDGAPGMSRPGAIAFAEALAARGGEDRRALGLHLIETTLARLALSGVRGAEGIAHSPTEAVRLARLSPDRAAARAWAEAHSQLPGRLRQGLAINLDPSALLLDMVLSIDATAARVLSPPGQTR